MSSTTCYILATAFVLFGGLGTGVFTILGHYIKQKETEASGKAAIEKSNQADSRIQAYFRPIYDSLGIGMAAKSASLPLFDNAPAAVREAYDKGQAFVEKGDYPSAIVAFSDVLRFKPDYADGYIMRASAYRSMAEDLKAISDYNEAIRLNPHSSEAYRQRGFTYYHKFLSSLSKPDTLSQLVNNGENVDLANAVADCNEAVHLNPNDWESHVFRGMVRTFKDIDGAIDDFTEAIGPAFVTAKQLREPANGRVQLDIGMLVNQEKHRNGTIVVAADRFSNDTWAVATSDDLDDQNIRADLGERLKRPLHEFLAWCGVQYVEVGADGKFVAKAPG